MARKIHSVDIEFDGDTRTLYYRKPSAAFMFRTADEAKKGKSNTEQAKDAFAECLCFEDGTKYAPSQLQDLLDEDWDAIKALMDTIIPQPKPKADKDAEKNA